MSDIPGIDPTKPEDQGAAGGGDDDAQDWSLPGGPLNPADPASKKKSFWEQIETKRGARPKGPYAYKKVPQDDKGFSMSKPF